MTSGLQWPGNEHDHRGTGARARDGAALREADAIETVVIRAEISETRERMSQTLDELGERLNPQTLKENVKDSIREATIGRVSHMAQNAAERVSRTTSGVTDSIRDNPIPAAMVAIGLGWMFFNNRSSSNEDRSRQFRRQRGFNEYRATGGLYADAYGTSGYEGRSGRYDAGQDEHGAVDRVKDRAHDLSDSARERAGELAHQARETADAVKHKAQDLAGSVANSTRRSAGRVEDAFYENPLALGAMSLAIGLAAGFAAPVTDREVRLMGDARDEVVDHIKDVAEDAKEKAQHVASRVMEEGKTAAREEGLTS